MRVAFLVSAHTNVPQLSELVLRLNRDGNKVFIHFDCKSTEDISKIGPYVIRNRLKVYHGGFSQVQATLELIRAAKDSGDFDYFMLLSGQCFPVNSLSWLESQLVDGRNYINYYRMPSEINAKRLDRLQYYHLEAAGANSPFARAANRILKKLPKRDFVKGMSLWPYAGSQWWLLSKDVIEYILYYISLYPNFYSYMKTTSYSDEVFFHSIISEMRIEDRLYPALFYARFNPSNGHPVVFGADSYGEIPKENVFIARKFDTRIDNSFLDVFNM